MYRKVCHETGANTKEQVESVLTQCAQVKTDTARLGGFSPSQWVLGRAPRTLPSFASEEEHASLGATAARHDPSSTFALQHQARLEAQKAYAHLECSRRVQKALLRNAVPFDREFSVGDLVTSRRDNQREAPHGLLFPGLSDMKVQRAFGFCVEIVLFWFLPTMSV